MEHARWGKAAGISKSTVQRWQREELQRWLRRSKTSQALASRARIVLACAEGGSDLAVARDLGTTRETVGQWRRRFVQAGYNGLLDAPRPGAPRRIGDDHVERVVVQTLEALPAAATHWSTPERWLRLAASARRR